MPIHKTEIVDGNIRLWPSSAGYKTADTEATRLALPTDQRDDTGKLAEQLTTELQNQMDVRQPIDSLPDDDPDKTIDPDRPDLFWDRSTRELVSRSVIVTVTWNGSEYVILVQRVA